MKFSAFFEGQEHPAARSVLVGGWRDMYSQEDLVELCCSEVRVWVSGSSSSSPSLKRPSNGKSRRW